MAAPPPTLALAVEKGPRAGETRQCSAGAALRVGRVVKGNDLAVRDGGASQQHLVIEFLPPPGAGWAVSDLGSSNGTLLNGKPLAPSVPAPLSHGDLIKVGDSTVLAVSIAPDSDPKPVANPSSRRSSRQTAVVAPIAAEEKPPAVTRRGARKKAPPAAQHPDTQKEDPEAEGVAVDEKPQVVARRGGWQKLAAAEPLFEMETVKAPRRGEQRKPVEPSAPENEEVDKEEATAVPRRGRRKNAAQPPELEKEKEEATVVTRRGRHKNVVGPSEPEKEEEEEATAVTRRGRQKNVVGPSEPEKEEEEEAMAVTRRGRQKNVVEPSEPEKEEEATAVTRRGMQKNAVQPPEPEKEKEEEATVVTRFGRQKNVVEPPKPEKEEEEEAPVVTNRRGRKKNVVTDAPPQLPPKMRSIRGRGKKASASDMVLEDVEEKGGNELAVSRARPEDLLVSATLKGVKAQKRDKVASGDGDIEGAAVSLEEKVPKGRASARLAAFDNGANAAAAPIEEMEEAVDATLRGRQKKDVEPHEPEKDEEEEAMVVTRRGRRKKNMEPHEPEKEEKEDKAPVVMHHGATKKNAAPVAPVSLPPKRKSARGRGRPTRASTMNTVLEEEVVEEEQGGNKLSASRARTGKPPTSTTVKKGDNAAAVDGEVKRTAKPLEEKLPKRRAVAKLAANNISYAAAAKPTEEMEEATEASHHGGQKAMEHPELENDEDVTMVTHRGERKRAAVVKRRVAGKKDVVAVMRSGRGRGRVGRTRARNNVPEEDNMVVEKENELPVPRELAGNLPVATAVNGGEDREVKGTKKAVESELPKGRASAQSSSDNKSEEEQGGADGSSRVASAQSSSDNKGGANGSSRLDSGSNGIPNTTSKYREDRKLKPYSTPFDVRLDRALKKYSA
ncbi:hypothetical protein CFC21_035006 [Triticum aestivum]|uniref:FHA domain-containing protein n=2 Tax=Triticum aestivum TaxID=4565 RepID=A0A9R1F4P8_WHEAT|nr:hypothetical protein CFC21_035006 [Triticum aestivum]